MLENAFKGKKLIGKSFSFLVFHVSGLQLAESSQGPHCGSTHEGLLNCPSALPWNIDSIAYFAFDLAR